MNATTQRQQTLGGAEVPQSHLENQGNQHGPAPDKGRWPPLSVPDQVKYLAEHPEAK